MAFSYIASFARSLYHRILNWLFPEKSSQVAAETTVAKATANYCVLAASEFSLSEQFAFTQKALYFSIKLFPLRRIQYEKNPFDFIIPSQSCLLAVFGSFRRICRPVSRQYAITSSSKTQKNINFAPFQRAKTNFVSSSTLLNAKVNNNGLAFVALAPFCTLTPSVARNELAFSAPVRSYRLSSAVAKTGIAFTVLSPFCSLSSRLNLP